MRKLQLDVESLTLESYDIPQTSEKPGTVNAHLVTAPCVCTICITCGTCAADCSSAC